MDSTAAVTNGHVVEDVLVTNKLASFVSDASYDILNPTVVQKLKELLIDHIGVASNAACNAESSQPFMDAILAFGGSQGASTVYAKGKTFPTQYAALLNGAFAHTYDFDDTFAAGALHPGASVVPAALAQSESSSTDCKALLIALAVGYEVVCRLARALGAGSYLRGFHSTGTAGIFGAIAAVGKVKNLSSDVIETAFGIAGSKAAGSMQFLENGSWNKRLHPGFAAHDALLCVSLAEAGVKGSSRVFEGTSGFLHSYTDKAVLKGLVEGLGNEWIFLGTALKPYPACRMTHASIEIAEKISKEKAVTVESISVTLSPTCWNIVGVPKPNKIRPENIVDAQFSIYVQAAIAWRTAPISVGLLIRKYTIRTFETFQLAFDVPLIRMCWVWQLSSQFDGEMGLKEKNLWMLLWERHQTPCRSIRFRPNFSRSLVRFMVKRVL